jgi:glycosyltransferase involved in cell wall biosynthesis
MYTCDNIQKLDEKIILDVFTGEAGNSLRMGRRNLKSERVLRSRLLLPLVLAWDLMCVLSRIRGKVDLIHVMVEHYSLVGMFLSRILRAPYIVTVCGTYAVRLPVFSKAFRYAYEQAHSLVAISNYTRRRMIEIGIKRTIEVITLGVDKTVFQPSSQNARSDEILFVGNLKARKGFDMVLKAMETVNARRKDIGLVVAGKVNLDSMEAKRVLGIIESKELNVKFTGFVTEKELIRLYQKTKLNVLPSKSEPFFSKGSGSCTWRRTPAAPFRSGLLIAAMRMPSRKVMDF